MRPTILAFCAILLTSGGAQAFDLASTFHFPPAGMMSPQEATPMPTVKKQRSTFHSTASLGATPGRLASRRLFGSSPLASAAHGKSGFLGLSSAGSMAIRSEAARTDGRRVPCGSPETD